MILKCKYHHLFYNRKSMRKEKWEVKTHEEKPNWGMGDYDEYYEVVNERGDAIQTTDNFDNLHVIADALNSFDGELRITTALEINLHCDNQMLKMENERLRAENSKMRKALEAEGYCTMCHEKKKKHALLVCDTCYDSFDGDRRSFWDDNFIH